jgi:signal transduction histidine kinase
LAEREQNASLLQKLNETLESRVQHRTKELNHAREMLAFALDSAGMGSWDTDLVTGTTRRSLRHDRIFGYPNLLPSWDRETFLRHVVDEDRALAEAAFSKAEKSGIFDLECKIKRNDGELRWIAAKGQVANSKTGLPERMAGVVMDISDRRFAEEALRQSQKMQAIGQLTGGLAHDFNNLLTGITGSLELLQTRIAQGRLKGVDRYVNAAQGAAKRAAALTNRLLAFSRQQTLDPKPTNMNRLVADMTELLRRTVGPFIRLETVFAKGLWPTLCDPYQLENALLNFCINSSDAMPNGGLLTLETANISLDQSGAHERDMLPGQYVALSVSDTGSGMSADVVARAFDPFFTTKPIGAGTGLGLSMAYGFARQSGGQVRIYSEIGKGTTVRLYLPRHNEEEAIEVTSEPSAVPLLARQGETVLVVDDEPTVRMLVTEVLEDLGYAPLEAGDATGALEIVQSATKIDLLITDVGLPGQNGRQLADAARSLRPKLKVLFITGYAENAAVGHGHLESGMHVLTKPFAMSVLAEKIRDIITQP